MKQNKRFLFMLLLVTAVVAFSCNPQADNKDPVESDTAAASGPQQQLKPTDEKVLTGNWIRTDAEYRLELSNVTNDGKMKAGYFNPKSINVAGSRWTNDGGVLRVYIELRDVNYPGSKYNLAYIPGRNILSGEYFQAVEQITYQVQFVRVNEANK